MQEREPVGVLAGFERGFVHQAANGEVSHHEAVEFLANQVGGFAAQDDLGAAQMGLEFIERGFDFPYRTAADNLTAFGKSPRIGLEALVARFGGSVTP